MAQKTNKQKAAYPKVKKSALVGPKKPTGRPKPLATKMGVTMNGKQTH